MRDFLVAVLGVVVVLGVYAALAWLVVGRPMRQQRPRELPHDVAAWMDREPVVPSQPWRPVKLEPWEKGSPVKVPEPVRDNGWPQVWEHDEKQCAAAPFCCCKCEPCLRRH